MLTANGLNNNLVIWDLFLIFIKKSYEKEKKYYDTLSENASQGRIALQEASTIQAKASNPEVS
jgi:hypothetical protein